MICETQKSEGRFYPKFSFNFYADDLRVFFEAKKNFLNYFHEILFTFQFLALNFLHISDTTLRDNFEKKIF